MSGLLHSAVVSLLVLLYIPYCLHWSPAIHQLREHKGHTGTQCVMSGRIFQHFFLLEEISTPDFDWRIFDKALVIILLFLLITDLFLIVGVRKEHK